DHQRAPPHAVDEQAGERRREVRQREHEEDEPGSGVRAGQLTHPDPEREEDRPVAEERERLAEQEDAGVPVGEQPAHQTGYARVMRRSPLIVRARSSTSGPSSPPAASPEPSSMSESRSPLTAVASTPRREPRLMPTRRSPEIEFSSTSPDSSESSWTSPETVSTFTESAASRTVTSPETQLTRSRPPTLSSRASPETVLTCVSPPIRPARRSPLTVLKAASPSTSPASMSPDVLLMSRRA